MLIQSTNSKRNKNSSIAPGFESEATLASLILVDVQCPVVKTVQMTNTFWQDQLDPVTLTIFPQPFEGLVYVVRSLKILKIVTLCRKLLYLDELSPFCAIQG